MELKAGQQAVNLRTTVKVKGVKHEKPGKQKMVAGKEYSVHPLTAQNLVDTGHAEYVDKKDADAAAAKTTKPAGKKV